MRGLIRMIMRVALPGLIGKLIKVLPALVARLRGSNSGQTRSPLQRDDERAPNQSRRDDGPIDQAFARGQSDIVLTEHATVITELPDDTIGDRHQRILVELDSGLTVLIAHNIDLTRRVAEVKRGERIRFKGEYEFNDKGGVVHWTHHDPKGWHQDGWIEYDGEVYG